jgi:hypothetical protein
LYYLYLAFLFPYLALIAFSTLGHLWEDREVKPLAILGLALLFINISVGISAYQSTVEPNGKFSNAQEVGEFMRGQTDHDEIYGSHEVAPLIALLSDKKLFDNHIDTNGQVFAAGTLNIEKVSTAAANRGVYLLARISDYPELGIEETGFEAYFSRTIFDKFCTRVKLFPSTSNETDNYIGVYNCQTPAN